jgi:ribonuclease E
MTKEIYISSTPHETRLAVVEDDQLAEIYYERENEYTLAGSVYKGKVTRVLPGMQSAFVDIGLERDAFLYVTDFAEESEDGEEYVALTPGQAAGHPTPSASNGHAVESQPRNPERQQQNGNPPRREESHSIAPRAEGAADTPAGETGAGAKRWRGRRGRRRGRSHGGAQDSSVSKSVENPSQQGDSMVQEHTAISPEAVLFEPDAEDYEIASYPPEQREHHPAEPAHEAPRQLHPSASPAPAMVLPGESLSKYRTGPAAPAVPPTHNASAVASSPAASISGYQPPTMVTGPLAWDGSDVLPGESLSRYKNKPRETQQSQGEPESQGTIESARSTVPLASPQAEAGLFPDAERQTADEPTMDGTKSQAMEAMPAAENAENFAPTEPGQFPDPPREAQTTRAVEAAHEEAPVHTPERAADFDPTQGSASYRFDPTKPSAYLQNLAAESVLAEPGTAVHSPEERYPVTASQPAQASAQDAAVPEPSAEQMPNPEPFFGESVSIAPHHHTEPAVEAPASVNYSRASEAESDHPQAEDLDAPFDPEAEAHTLHAFNPGLGNLEEEMIDEEEAEAFAAQTLLEEAEYDDLVEETMDVQMDSGMLSELVRDRHIEQRTRFVEEPGSDSGADEAILEEDSEDEAEEDSFDEPIAAMEFESVSDSTFDEDVDESAPARNMRPDPQRNQRRGIRGQQRQGQRGDRGWMRRGTAQTSNLPVITELLKPNQEILVQIAKEPIARKGARITSHIALPGRFLVFMPTVNHVGVSRKISSDEERQRLKRILLSEKGAAGGGFIVRTAAATASEEDLRADIRFLLTLWAEMRQRAESSKPPALIYHDLSLVERVLRDQVTDNFSAIWVDSEADYERVLRFLNRFEPSLVRRVKLYTKETPLFEQFGIQEEINKALRSKVWLKSGGSIVINQTEALVAIDINTGKYVGKTARLEDTILKTNLDAIPEIVRQIRLRDLGGIIVIDFIDMDERKNRNKVMQALEDELKHDRAPSKVLQFNDFGLVAITRKRVKQSLERTLSVPCSICTGTGMVKGPITVCNEIYIELRKMHRQFDRADVMLRVHPEVVKQLKASNGRWLTEMEEMSGKTIIVKSDAALHPEQFDIH